MVCTMIVMHLQFITYDYRLLPLDNSLQNCGYWCCLEGAQQNHLSLEMLIWETSYTNKILKCSDMKHECFLPLKLQDSMSLKVWIAQQATLMDSRAGSFFVWYGRHGSILMNSGYSVLTLAIVENFSFYRTVTCSKSV